jgi:hypothetical protein
MWSLLIRSSQKMDIDHLLVTPRKGHHVQSIKKLESLGCFEMLRLICGFAVLDLPPLEMRYINI